MKRITAIITAAALCAALCGCAKTEESSSSGGYYFAADNGSVETKQEKLENAVESYVKTHAAIYGSYDGIRIGSITEDSGHEYSATGKYWVLDSFGDRHCYKFSTTVTYISGEAKVSSDYTDWNEY